MPCRPWVSVLWCCQQEAGPSAGNEGFFLKKTALHIAFLVLYCLALWIFNSNLEFTRPGDYPEGLEYARATVTRVVEQEMGPDPDFDYIQVGKQTLELTIHGGEYAGKTITAPTFVTRTTQLAGQVGTKYIVGSYDGFITSTILYYDRTSLLVLLVAAFLAMVLFYGAKKGVAAIAGLVVTLLNVVFLFIPLLINGMPAIPAAILVVLLSSLYTMVVLNGVCRKSMIATLCCTACTAFAGLLAWIVSKVGNISTLNTPEVEDLLFITQNSNFRIDNLLVAGILIAAMGAVMDTSMSIVSALYELRDQNPGISRQQLRQSGMNIGKDVMGTMTNTLVLAFAGSSLNLMVIYYMYCMPAISLLNTDFMVVEIVKGIIGSMAVVLATPVTAIATSVLMEELPAPAPKKKAGAK